MRTVIAATVLATLVSGTAYAGDLARKAPPVPDYPQSVVDYGFNWTGVYVGANAGYRWADVTAKSGGDGNVGLNSTSAFGGGQIGANWQTGNFVYGVETDFGYGSSSKSRSLTSDYSAKTTFEGTTRARAGVAFDRALLYGTAGIAYADFTSTYNSVKKDNWRIGWTVGGGLEYAVTKNVSVKGEYLYADYGTENVGGSKQDITTNLVRVGLNYKF